MPDGRTVVPQGASGSCRELAGQIQPQPANAIFKMAFFVNTAGQPSLDKFRDILLLFKASGLTSYRLQHLDDINQPVLQKLPAWYLDIYPSTLKVPG